MTAPDFSDIDLKAVPHREVATAERRSPLSSAERMLLALQQRRVEELHAEADALAQAAVRALVSDRGWDHGEPGTVRIEGDPPALVWTPRKG